ncbi:MAG: hypothetical protein IKS44_04635 [Bacteroidales bacterium]|nr:hypothetical protein [Bacteroidales bacterium]
MKKVFVILAAAVVAMTTLSCNKEDSDNVLEELGNRLENVFSLPGTTWHGDLKRDILTANANADATVTFQEGNNANVNFLFDISMAGVSLYTIDTALTCQYRFVGVEGLLYDTNSVELTMPFKKIDDTTINLYYAMPSAAANYGVDTLVIPMYKVK